jgi:DNA-binding response OmpR family regulator
MKESPTILLVEDSTTQAKQIKLQLARHGVEVIIAEDGPEGLDLAEKHQPALVLLDVNLPTMNGYQVCRRLQRDEKTAHIPVIMLTSAGGSDDTLEGLEAGAIDYIPKDAFAIDNLLVTLQALGILKASGED